MARLLLSILLIGSLAGCAAKPAAVSLPSFSRLRERVHFEYSDAMASNTVLPWMGCQWTYDGPEPATFEVWASTNLVDWVLATNTVATRVLFPPKSCEFYRVRTRDELGQVSDWAKVPE